MNDELLREAEEDLRKERLEALWDRYKLYIIGGIAALILSVALYNIYDYAQTRQSQKATALLEKAQIEPDISYLDVLPDLPSRQGLLAAMMALPEIIEREDYDQARLVFEQTIDSKRSDPMLRDLIRIHYAAFLMSRPNTEFTEIEVVLRPVYADVQNIWHSHAALYMAVAHANIGGAPEEAVTILEKLADNPKAMPQIRQIGAQLMPLYRSYGRKETS